MPITITTGAIVVVWYAIVFGINRKALTNIREFLGVVLVATVWLGVGYAVWHFHEKDDAGRLEAKDRVPSISEWLDECSPFESLDGTRSLDFKISDNTVEMTEAVDEEKAAGALLAKHPKVDRGTWSADEATKQVILGFDTVKTRYLLVIAFSEDQCILSAGDISSADLRTSWFGTAPYVEPDVSDRDPDF
mgnify:CR=1 FL=1